MKRIVYALAATLAIAGCSLAPAKFDQVEQLGYATMYQYAHLAQNDCGQPDKVASAVLTIAEIAELLSRYLAYQPDTGSIDVLGAFQRLLGDFRTDGGTAYCRDSMINLQDALIRAMQTNGRRER